ncbi:MAG: STAS domain-containing protein [Spirochaetia bacterium]|nr:STAS domain-containing protein [Spirochaetia bacterium]
MDFKIAQSSSGSIIVLKMIGKLDAQSAPTANEQLRGQIGTGHSKIVLDFSELTYISSAGLGILNANQADAKKAGGGIRLAAVTPQVKDVFDLMKFTLLFPMFPGVQDAVAGF